MVYYLLYQKATVCPQTAKKRSWWKFHQFLTTKAIRRSLRQGESCSRDTRYMTLINGGCKIETTIEWNLMNISKCSQRQSNFALKNCFKVPMPKILLIFAKGEISKVLWKSSSWLLIRNICYRRNFFRDLFFKDFV